MTLLSRIKNKYRHSRLVLPLRYLHYFIYRYLVKRHVASCEIRPGVVVESVDNETCFFGYYNISPENSNGDITYLKVKNEDTRASLIESAKIMVKKADGKITQIGKTRAWNWQQGCMLQWFPKGGSDILFNDYDDANDRYVAKIIDIDGNLLRAFDMPANNVSVDGKFALSLNYDRLAKMQPDYGYFNRKNNEVPDDDQDGIWYFDLASGHTTLIITLEQLKALSYSSSMDGAKHKVNHIDINPSGTRFMFLHRWVGPQGRFMRLITANSDGSDLYILNGDIMTSHCCWLNDKEILSFCCYNGEKGYFKFLDQLNEVCFFSEIMLKGDGHPSRFSVGGWIITDSYPDKSRISSLYLYNIEKDYLMTLGRFFQPMKHRREMRIDLHPKWSEDGGAIFIESGHSGKRQLYKINISGIV